MRTRPILFSAPMVRAILEGRKTQTRRLCQHSQHWGGDDPKVVWKLEEKCPYGEPGDGLWVRESCKIHKMATGTGGERVIYADNFEYSAGKQYVKDWFKSTPSIHMPRWASRILLEVVDVRVHRLQNTQEVDARAEGVEITVRENGALAPFRELWDSINGKRIPWASNPWVWAVTFKRLMKCPDCDGGGQNEFGNCFTCGRYRQAFTRTKA